MARVTFGVLGPIEAAIGPDRINLKGLRQRAVLARLLIAKGRVVPASWLIDDLWDEAPEGALGAVQTFVGALRKALEPDRPPRSASQLLVTVSPGYALRAAPERVDAGLFEAAVADSAQLLAGGQAEKARTRLDEALALWRGPAYAEFAEEDWARAEAARLNELRLLAVVRRAEAALALGQAAESVPDLEAHIAAHPLREDSWRLLALALYRSGRQGDALATLRRAREVLRTELGVDPGQGLSQLEADILAQAPHLNTGPESRPAEHPFVGRAEELAELDNAATAAATAGQPRLVLVSGAAGAGKTVLARTLTGRLEATGWTTAWGTSPELQGAPAAWPWTQMRATLTPARPEPTLTATESPDQDPLVTRFLRHRAIGSYLATVSRRAPVLLVFDDVHWADEETLALLTALATDPDAGRVLIVATYRSTEISSGLTEALGRAAGTEPTRIYLSGLTEPQVGQIVQAVTHRAVTAEQARVIHARSAGNPFFVRELARLWEAEGDAGLRTVPAGVRDVIRHRLAGLPEPARTHLRQAAVIGQDVDVDVLISLAGNEDQVLTSIESALLAGFLIEQDADRLRFAHALVRETLYDDVAHARRARWHTAVAEIIERKQPDEVETIAHHFLRADSRITAARAAHYAGAAAQRAEHRCAPHQAERLWRQTVAALDRSDHRDARSRLDATMGMVRALAVTGDLRQARRLRGEAITEAENLNDPLLTAGVIGSFEVPAIWTANDDEALSHLVVAAAETTLDNLPARHEAERARLLTTIAMERRADAGRRGRQAAGEAETIARALDDPVLLALALNARFMQTFHRAGLAPQRAHIGQELLQLATSHGGMVTFEVLGHLILIQASAALADFETAGDHAAAADRLAERYDLPLVGVFTGFYAALRLAVIGRLGEAEAAYRAVAGRLPDTGMSGVEEGILPLALLSLAAPNAVPAVMPVGLPWGPYESWARPLILLAHGERGQALTAARTIPDSPRDLLFEARTCLHAMAAVQAGDRPTMRRLYAELLPAARELAGAASGLVTFGPTALYLGHLAAALGRPGEAAEHYRQAESIANQAQAPHWAAAARDAVGRLGP